MQSPRKFSPQTVQVLRALAAEPSRYRYGYDLVTEVGLKSGSLYPILIRLADRGLLEAVWEEPVEGKPPRHLYRLTGTGREAALQLAGVPATAPQRLRPREAR